MNTLDSILDDLRSRLPASLRGAYLDAYVQRRRTPMELLLSRSLPGVGASASTFDDARSEIRALGMPQWVANRYLSEIEQALAVGEDTREVVARAKAWMATSLPTTAEADPVAGALTDRRYHVVVINERTGAKHVVSRPDEPLTHAEGVTFMSKMSNYAGRRIQLEEVVPSVASAAEADACHVCSETGKKSCTACGTEIVPYGAHGLACPKCAEQEVDAIDKDQPSRRIYGNTTEVVVTSSRGALKVIPARFVLMSAHDLIPSHDSQTFDPRPDYPKGVQERRYEVDRNEQIKVTGVAQDMHPGLLQSTSTGAVDGTPVISAGDAAVVLGGNGRSMGAQRHYKSGRTILRDYVIEHAGEFGVTAAQALRIEDPIIVREVDVPRTEWPRMVRDLNVTLTQTMDADTEAAAQARQLPPDVIRTLAIGLAQGEIGEFLRSRASLGLVGALERSGFINRSNRGRMVGEDGLLSREATLQLERQLLALLVPNTSLLERLGLEIRGTLNRSAPLWLAAAANGLQWDLREPLLAALSDLRTMRHDNQCLAQWLQQASFGRDTQDATIGRLLLEILDLAGGKPVVFAKIARAYFEASSSGGLFGGGAEPMQALSEAAIGANINPASAVSKRRCKKP